MSPTPPMGLKELLSVSERSDTRTPQSTRPDVVFLPTGGPLGTAFKPWRSHRKPCGAGVTGIASVAEDHRRQAESGFRDRRRVSCRRKRDGFQTLSNAGCPRRPSTNSYASTSRGHQLIRLPSDCRSTGPRSSATSTAEASRRRRVVRKMTDLSVHRAATRYESGESLKVVAAQFGVDARTLAREFKRAGIKTRPRRGWPPSQPASDRTERSPRQ